VPTSTVYLEATTTPTWWSIWTRCARCRRTINNSISASPLRKHRRKTMQGWKTNALLGVTAGLLLLPGAARAGARRIPPRRRRPQRASGSSSSTMKAKSDKAIDSVAKKVVARLPRGRPHGSHAGAAHPLRGAGRCRVMVSKSIRGPGREGGSRSRHPDRARRQAGRHGFDLRQRVARAEDGTQSTSRSAPGQGAQTLSATLEKRGGRSMTSRPVFQERR